MDAADAVQCAKMIQCRKIIGVHYDTFGFIRIDKARARKLFADAGSELFLPAIGETINPDSPDNPDSYRDRDRDG